MKLSVSITVNGRAYDREIEPRLLLVHFLRDSLALTGTKKGFASLTADERKAVAKKAAVGRRKAAAKRKKPAE